MLWTALCAGFSVFCAFDAIAQEQSGKWFDVPLDQSALVVIADTKEPTTLYATDAEQQKLDKFLWDFGSPLVRQYRLNPGHYQVVVNDNQDDRVDLKLNPGELNYLHIVPGQNASPKIDDYGPIKRNVSAIVDDLTFKGYGNYVTPQRLEMTGNTLYLNTEPPFPIPRPGDKPPKKVE